MSFFKRKVEELQTKRAESENLKGFENIFGKPLAELQSIFTSSVKLDERKHEIPPYPSMRYLGELGINAFGLVHHVEPDQFPLLFNLVKDGRREVAHFHFARELGGQSLNTIVSPAWRFSERDVSLLSNDVELLATLAKQGLHPPPPWITLFELGPMLYISQGDAHYWLNYVWDPYWESLSLDEQTRFLEEGRKATVSYISQDDWQLWVESIRMRDVRYRKLED